MQTSLSEVVRTLAALDSELTIYAVPPWTCDATALVHREPDDGAVPDEAKVLGAVYFLEVAIALEVLSEWRPFPDRAPTDQERCERVIRYAINDA